jgi:hypothetical protein
MHYNRSGLSGAQMLASVMMWAAGKPQNFFFFSSSLSFPFLFYFDRPIHWIGKSINQHIKNNETQHVVGEVVWWGCVLLPVPPLLFLIDGGEVDPLHAEGGVRQ